MWSLFCRLEGCSLSFLWSLPVCGWSWLIQGLPDGRDWWLPPGRWSWFLSLWWVGLCLWVWLGAAYLLMCGAVILPCLLSGLGLLSPDGCGQIFPKWQPQGSSHRWLFLGPLSPMSCPHSESWLPLLSKEILQELPVGLIHIPVESLLCPVIQCTWKPVCLPESCGAPVLKPHWPSMPFNAKCSRASSSQCQTPQAWEPNVELQIFPPVEEPLQCSYFPVCGSPTD